MGNAYHRWLGGLPAWYKEPSDQRWVKFTIAGWVVYQPWSEDHLTSDGSEMTIAGWVHLVSHHCQGIHGLVFFYGKGSYPLGPTPWSLKKSKTTQPTEDPVEEQMEAQESERKKKKMKKRKEREVRPSPSPPVKKSKFPTDAPTSSTKGRETRSTKGSKTVCDSGKLFVKLFQSTVAKSFFPDVVKKSIIPQRNLDVPDFNKKTNLLPILHSNKLFKSVTLPGSYVKKVVQEFFYNLSDSGVTDGDPSYHKVFVRGKLYEFSPSVINTFLGTTPNPVISPIAEETVWNDLTNGLKDYQHGKSKVPSSVMKFAVAKFNKNKNGLPYPLLIYSILKDQSFEKEENEEEEPIPPLLQVDGRHLEGSHFNDMAVARTTTAPTQNPASVEYQLSFVEKEIKALQQDIDYHNEIAQRAAARRDTLIHVANTLRQAKGASVQRPSLLHGHNHNFWKGCMRAFLKSQGGGVWRTVETGWTEPVKFSEDLSTSTIKKFEVYSRTEVVAAEYNDKALNAIFGAVDATQYHLISNCVSAKEAWDILEVTHEARLQEPFPESKLVLKVLRSLPERFDMDVKAISQSHDTKKMTLDALMGNLETIELNMKEDSKRRKPEKQIAFLGTDQEGDGEDGLTFDEEFQEQLSLFTKQFKKKWIQKKGKNTNQEGPSKTSTFRESRFKEGKSYDNSSKYKGPLCFECGGHVHIHIECANNLKKKRQAFSITWSDEDTDEDQGCGESNCAFTSQSESDDLIEQHMDLQEKLTELLMVNRRNIAEKNKLALDLKTLKQSLEKAETNNANLKFELQKLKDYVKWMKIAGAEVLDAQEMIFKVPGDRQGIGCISKNKADGLPKEDKVTAEENIRSNHHTAVKPIKNYIDKHHMKSHKSIPWVYQCYKCYYCREQEVTDPGEHRNDEEDQTTGSEESTGVPTHVHKNHPPENIIGNTREGI
ncbi:unnamed protein product [Cuscuta campestris]|uniref:Uncharacterized protein n=1 Tax=Cuscuta campestris TaxID=132261 RepID=A0A484LBD9_9ASTE|nr:unnamed protein product [Cuscuta campestris]